MKHHFESKHNDFNDKFSGEFRKEIIASLLKFIKCQQNIFKTFSNISKNSTVVSFDIAILLVICSRPFTEDKFVKTMLRKSFYKTLK